MTTLMNIKAPYPSLDDAHLASQARTDPEAFAELYSRHVRSVYRYYLAHTGDIKDAEDLTSQTFMAALEGTRPLLLELQALVTPAHFGTPRRTVLGADYNRVCLLLAILEKRAGIPLQSQDVFVNVAGGARCQEPAADLAIAVASASSYGERALAPDVVVLGEVGLTGEVRAIGGLETRLREAAALGFGQAVVPRSSLVAGARYPLTATGVSTLEEAIGLLVG